jgi:SPP1 family predicted phage head-tail adaptor
MPNTRGAGTLDQPLTILNVTYASSTQSGQGVASFTVGDQVWGSVRSMSSDEVLRAQSIGSQTNYEIEIRFRTDVTPKMRLRWTPFTGTSRTFEIHGIQLGDRRADRLVLRCGEVI